MQGHWIGGAFLFRIFFIVFFSDSAFAAFLLLLRFCFCCFSAFAFLLLLLLLLFCFCCFSASAAFLLFVFLSFCSLLLLLFCFGSCSPFSFCFCFFHLFALQRRNQTRKQASKHELLTFGSGVLLGGALRPPQPPPRHEICTSSPTPAPATKSIF